MLALQKFLLLLLLAFFGQHALGSEIRKGKKAKKNTMMYMASVQDQKEHVCGGFLISEDFVMTAAHCDGSEDMSVVLGTHNLDKIDETMRYNVTKCKHRDYDSDTLENDIMLLKLSQKVHQDKKRPIKPVQLPNHQTHLKPKKKCKVAGWGPTKLGENITKDLQVADVPIVDQKTCQKLWQDKLPPNVICASGYGTKKGVCKGDSGGPLVCDKDLAVGVVSFKYKKSCIDPILPNVYTDISKFLLWINNILKNKTC